MGQRMDKDELWRRHTALSKLSRSEFWEEGTLKQAFQRITKVASEILSVSRVGIWLFNDARDAIELADLYGHGRHSSGVELRRDSYPGYFVALDEERLIVASDAYIEKATSEFVPAYLAANGIGALLDAPIIVRGRSIGVVCSEHVGGSREWSNEELLFAASLADFVAIAVESDSARKAQRSLDKQGQMLRLALAAANMGTWQWELSTGELTWSDQVGPLLGRPFGYQPVSMDDFIQSVHPEDREMVRNLVSSRLESGDTEYQVVHRTLLPDGQVRWIEGKGEIQRSLDGQPERMAGVVADITERRHLEERFVQAEKMESIGRLAGGVAHDFNNLLQVMLGNLSLIELHATENPKVMPLVEHMRGVSHRAAGLTRQLLTFARKQVVHTRDLNLGHQLNEVGEMIRRIIGEDIHFELQLPSRPLVVRMDDGQLSQILINLAVNARDAMPHGGLLIISARMERHAPGGMRAVLTVTDNGEGIPESVLPKVFEPFFTTKPVGQGTGLGLATCYGIVQQAGGEINVWSTHGNGTEVEIRLPCVEGESENKMDSPDILSARATGQTLLLVEDKEPVRRLIANALRGWGFTVVEADNGLEGARLARERGDSLAAIVSDVVMPVLGGPAMVKSLRASGSCPPVIFMSGFSWDGASDHGTDPFLLKPFRNEELLNLLSKTLDFEQEPSS